MPRDPNTPLFDEQTALLLRAVAHDFNNLLGSVMGHAELLKSSKGDQAKLEKRTAAIERSALKAVEITRKLSASGRDLDLSLERLVLAEALREECRRFECTLSKQVVFQVDLEAELVVEADPRALNEVVSALLCNAREWCGTSGQITLSASLQSEGVVLQVSDTGPGFPDSFSSESLLDPFVGTGREGSGLGLWIVKRLMEAHGGHVRLSRGPEAEVRCVFPVRV